MLDCHWVKSENGKHDGGDRRCGSSKKESLDDSAVDNLGSQTARCVRSASCQEIRDKKMSDYDPQRAQHDSASWQDVSNKF